MRLKDRYANMETKELLKIISLDKEQYTQEAILAAKAELRKRGESDEILAFMPAEAQDEEKASLIINEDKSTASKAKRFGICLIAGLILSIYAELATSYRLRYYLPIGIVIMSFYSYIVSSKLTRLYPHP